MSFKHGLLFLAIAAISLPGCSSHKTVNTPVSGQPGAISSPTASATPVASPATVAGDASSTTTTAGNTAAASGGKTAAGSKNGGKNGGPNGSRPAPAAGDASLSSGQPQDKTTGSSGAAAGGQLTSTSDTIYFAFDDFSLSQDDRGSLQAVADRMKHNTGIAVELLGHADERGTVNYNLALGERRGQTVEAYLRALGIKADRMEVVSYGETKPAAEGHDENAWARNRRVEIHLLTP